MFKKGFINIEVDDFRKKIEPAQTARLLKLTSEGVINTPTAKMVYEEMFQTGKSADEIISEKGLSQISDTGQLEEAVLEVINSNVQPVSDYRAGKEQALKFLVGQVMKATKGRANPQLVNEVLQQKLAAALNPAGEE